MPSAPERPAPRPALSRNGRHCPDRVTDAAVGSGAWDPGAAERVIALLDLPAVADACTRAREACARLRWHEGLRRRSPEAAAESRVRGAWASARLDGAEVEQAWVRDLVRGALGRLPAPGAVPGPTEQTALGAVRATLESERVQPLLGSAPGQALTRLHTAAVAGSVPEGAVARPRAADEECRELVEVPGQAQGSEVMARLGVIRALLQAPPQVPAPLVAALVHAETAVARPFARGNGLLARALERAVLQARGLDPLGVAVPEAGHAVDGTAYVGALTAYATGDPAGLALWVARCGDAVVAGAAEGERIASAVRAGRLG